MKCKQSTSAHSGVRTFSHGRSVACSHPPDSLCEIQLGGSGRGPVRVIVMGTVIVTVTVIVMGTVIGTVRVIVSGTMIGTVRVIVKGKVM